MLYLRIVKNNIYIFYFREVLQNESKGPDISLLCLLLRAKTIMLLNVMFPFYLFFNSIRRRRHAEKRVITGA